MKKRIIGLVVVSVLTVGASSLTTFADDILKNSVQIIASDIVDIQDVNLKKEINKVLGKNLYSDITKTELESITSLKIDSGNIDQGNKISNLEGIQYCKNLKELEIITSDISDISVLETMINLESLFIVNSNISDMSAVSKLTNLRSLGLSQNQISDISVLENMINLEYI
ncbi:MAG: leucine-rich repeat domain-containing protein [Paraclostridium sp.]